MENKSRPTYYVGIDAGSVSLNGVVVNRNGEVLYEAPYHRHLGNIEEAVLEFIQKQYKKQWNF